MPRIASLENLHEAFLRAARGKCGKREVKDFRCHLEENLQRMGRELLEGNYRFGSYHFFTIHDPKERTICAATFKDRVAFHAMMRICHPVFDNYQISDSYASRIGKGTYKALERAQQLCRRYAWFAKMDMCKYFDSIDHEVMLRQLGRLFKDPQLLIYFRDLLDGYEVTRGKGLPIGNLTSQYFANHYLSVADHYMKQEVGVPGLVRYMDDILLFSNDRKELRGYVSRLKEYVEKELRLTIHDPVINRTCHGIPFLGYVVYGKELRLNQRSRKRFRQRMGDLEKDLAMGMISDKEYAMRASCLFAFIDKAEAADFRYRVFNQAMRPQGLQPREPWRQLEQQREELPCVESEQQQSVEPQQQPRLAPCPIAQPCPERLFHSREEQDASAAHIDTVGMANKKNEMVYALVASGERAAPLCNGIKVGCL